MSEPWFFQPTLQVGRIALDPDEAHHARNVRRLQPGDAVVLFDGRGGVARGALAGDGLRRKEVFVDVTQIELQSPDRAPLTIISAACKGERQAWMVEKLTELGVAALEFASFERSIVNLQASALVKLQRTAREACKQCRRAFDLRLSIGASCAESARRWRAAHPHGRLFFGDASLDRQVAAARTGDSAADAAAIVIGPEGGLTEAEVKVLGEIGGAPLRVGRYVLRIETAAIACAAAWVAENVHA